MFLYFTQTFFSLIACFYFLCFLNFSHEVEMVELGKKSFKYM